jgi:hypothetical protein
MKRTRKVGTNGTTTTSKKGTEMGFVLYDKADRKLVGASQPLYCMALEDAESHLDRMKHEDVATGRYSVLRVPE